MKKIKTSIVTYADNMTNDGLLTWHGVIVIYTSPSVFQIF